MSKKRPKGWLIDPKQVEAWLDKTEQQLVAKNYDGAVKIARRVLRYVPKGSEPFGQAYYYIGTALAMSQDFEGSYNALSKTLEVNPDDANAFYNRALAARILWRTGRALCDLERAVDLETQDVYYERYHKELVFVREIVQQQINDRGPDFTLEQLIEQQDTFWRGIKLMEAEKWTDAEAIFRRVIEMADVLPQPWANLAGCLMFQDRYDEAETALQRALEIDPDYELARQNLAMLPRIRKQGISEWDIKPPFEGHEIQQSITFVKD